MDLKIREVSCDGNYNSNLLCTTQLISTWWKITRVYQKNKWYTGMLILPLSWFSQVGIQGCLLVTTDKLS